MANREIDEEEHLYLIAKRKLNKSISANNGRPEITVVKDYALACGTAGFHTEAAEAYILAEQIDPNYDFATNICYHYDKAGKKTLSDKYGVIAYERNPSAVNAFNLALGKRNKGDLDGYGKYMQLAYEQDKRAPFILDAWGHYLISQNRTSEGMKILHTAFDIFSQEYSNDHLDQDNLYRFKKVSQTLGKGDFVSEISNRLEKYSSHNICSVEENLVVSTKQVIQKLRG